MYHAQPGLIIGFHGCDKARQTELLQNSRELPFSKEPYDWLGSGMYFWQNNYDRALSWAKHKEAIGKIKEAAVIGAVIDLSNCFDLLDNLSINVLPFFYKLFVQEQLARAKTLPENRSLGDDPHEDKALRFLDCALIEFMHQEIRERIATDHVKRGFSEFKPFDSVRSMFREGEPVYKGAGFHAKSHIQICIRNPNCIKGFFVKRNEIDFTQHDVNRTMPSG